MKRGGRVIYAGELGRHCDKLVEYFEVSFLCLHVLVQGSQDFTDSIEFGGSQYFTSFQLDR